MPPTPKYTLETLLRVPAVVEGMRNAWLDSNPGPVGGHEEGGFVCEKAGGELVVLRWPHGERSLIVVPDHRNCRFAGMAILVTFHTHPNTGPSDCPEPSDTDRQAIEQDANLKDRYYLGEFVISNETIYAISQDGSVAELASTCDILFP